jgi:hypothetical protein
MKTLFKVIILLIVSHLTSCKDEPGENEHAEEVKMLTASTWAHARVTHDDGDLSGQYTNFAIVFTSNRSHGFDGSFVISSGGYAFPESSGLWKFNDDFSRVIFDSEKEMVVVLTKEHLQLQFSVAAEAGKLYGTSGNFTFDLQPL